MDPQGQKIEASFPQSFSPEWCPEDRVDEHKSKMEIFLATKLYFQPEDLENEHLKLKSQIFPSAKSLDSKMEQLIRETEIEVDDNFSFFKQENSDNRNRCSKLEKVGSGYCTKKFGETEEALFSDMTTRPLNGFCLQSAEDYYKYFEQFAKPLPDKWRIYMNGWYRSEVDAFLTDMNHLISIVKEYLTDMGTLFKEMVCLEPQLFDKAHAMYLRKAVTSDENHPWTMLHLQSQMYEIIGIIQVLFHGDNLKASKQENEIISQAIIHAGNAYNQAMESKIRESVPSRTSTQIQEFHKLCKTAVVESFGRIPGFTYSSRWQLEQGKLERSLEEQLAKHLIGCSIDTPSALTKTKVAVAVPTNEPLPTSKPIPKYNPVPPKKAAPTFQPQPTHEPAPAVANKQAPPPQPAPTQQRSSSSKLNEATARRPTNVKPYGLGIFISQDTVHVGIYKNKNEAPLYYQHPPFITLKNDGIEFFKEDRTSSHNLNIIKILTDAQKLSKSLLISNQGVTLRAEEIVGLFFQKIRSKAASIVDMEDFKSCVVAVSALWCLSSKQMLKNSLQLAGFEKSRLIHTTTSIGLSYVLKSQIQLNDYVALVHQHSNGFDVALAQGSSLTLAVKRIYANESLVEDAGWFAKYNPVAYFVKSEEKEKDSDDVKLGKIVNSMLTALRGKEKLLKQIIFTTVKALPTKQKTLFKNIFKSSEWNFVVEQESIVLGASALSARCNGNLVLKNVEYKEVFPYTLTTKINEGGLKELVKRNAPLDFTKHLFPAADGKSNNSNTLSIYELSGLGEESTTLIGKYSMDTYNSTMGKANFKVNLTSPEGLIEVKLEKVDQSSPSSLRVQANFMTPPQLQDATANMSSISRLINGN